MATTKGKQMNLKRNGLGHWKSIATRLCMCGLMLGLAPAGMADELTPEQQAEVDQRPLGIPGNPVRCDMPNGERYYLARLVDPAGTEIDFERMGSFGGGPYGNLLDGYEVTVGDRSVRVFMDMYHPGYLEDRPLPGFYLRCRFAWDLVIREDGLRYAIGGDEPYDGVFEKTDPDTGKLATTVTLKAGLMEGPMVGYSPEGVKKYEVPFVAGNEQGTARYYHANGEVAATREYEQGREHGEAVWYFEDGAVQMRGQYEHGQGTGLWEALHPNGQVRLTGHYVANKREGEWTTYTEDGEVASVEFYHEGKVVEPPAGGAN